MAQPPQKNWLSRKLSVLVKPNNSGVLTEVTSPTENNLSSQITDPADSSSSLSEINNSGTTGSEKQVLKRQSSKFYVELDEGICPGSSSTPNCAGSRSERNYPGSCKSPKGSVVDGEGKEGEKRRRGISEGGGEDSGKQGSKDLQRNCDIEPMFTVSTNTENKLEDHNKAFVKPKIKTKPSNLPTAALRKHQPVRNSPSHGLQTPGSDSQSSASGTQSNWFTDSEGANKVGIYPKQGCSDSKQHTPLSTMSTTSSSEVSVQSTWFVKDTVTSVTKAAISMSSSTTDQTQKVAVTKSSSNCFVSPSSRPTPQGRKPVVQKFQPTPSTTGPTKQVPKTLMTIQSTLATSTPQRTLVANNTPPQTTTLATASTNSTVKDSMVTKTMTIQSTATTGTTKGFEVATRSKLMEATQACCPDDYVESQSSESSTLRETSPVSFPAVVPCSRDSIFPPTSPCLTLLDTDLHNPDSLAVSNASGIQPAWVKLDNLVTESQKATRRIERYQSPTAAPRGVKISPMASSSSSASSSVTDRVIPASGNINMNEFMSGLVRPSRPVNNMSRVNNMSGAVRPAVGGPVSIISGARGCRRSFTTEDLDIGLSKCQPMSAHDIHPRPSPRLPHPPPAPPTKPSLNTPPPPPPRGERLREGGREERMAAYLNRRSQSLEAINEVVGPCPPVPSSWVSPSSSASNSPTPGSRSPTQHNVKPAPPTKPTSFKGAFGKHSADKSADKLCYTTTFPSTTTNNDNKRADPPICKFDKHPKVVVARTSSSPNTQAPPSLSTTSGRTAVVASSTGAANDSCQIATVRSGLRKVNRKSMGPSAAENLSELGTGKPGPSANQRTDQPVLSINHKRDLPANDRTDQPEFSANQMTSKPSSHNIGAAVLLDANQNFVAFKSSSGQAILDGNKTDLKDVRYAVANGVRVGGCEAEVGGKGVGMGCGVEMRSGSSSSDTDTEEEGEEKLGTGEELVAVNHLNEGEGKEGVVLSKERKVAEEFLLTEKQYVEKLYLIDQIFHLQLIVKNRDERFLPEDVIPQIFSNIKSIYQFHHDFLLPQLQSTMDNWDSGMRIGHVLKKFAPFLKLYTDYIKNFDHAMNVINVWLAKSQKFTNFIQSVQRRPECGMLSLQHHLLEPIQRVPRYELLLKEYIKNLPEGCADKDKAQEALVLVAEASRHSCQEMRKIEKFRKLLDIADMLGGTVPDLVSSTRELVREGKLTKVSARDGAHSDRYLYLFNDMLLVCQSVPIKLGLRQQYVLKAKLDIEGMTVTDGDNVDLPNTFCIHSKQKSVELHTATCDEKDEWQIVLWKVIKEYTKKHLVNRSGSIEDVVTEYMSAGDSLGERAPTWVRDKAASMCMICTLSFTAFRRRHHCRACGEVVCSNCSTHKIALAYDSNRLNRVCNKCYVHLAAKNVTADQTSGVAATSGLQQSLEGRIEGESTTQPLPPPPSRSVLHVDTDVSSVISGYLKTRSSSKKNWRRRFITVHDNFVLYASKAHKDRKAQKALPLPGYKVAVVAEESCGPEEQFIFKVFHDKQPQQIFYFQAADSQQMNMWVSALQKLVQLELPIISAGTSSTTLTTDATSPNDIEDTPPNATENTPPGDATAEARLGINSSQKNSNNTALNTEPSPHAQPFTHPVPSPCLDDVADTLDGHSAGISNISDAPEPDYSDAGEEEEENENDEQEEVFDTVMSSS